MAKIGLISVKQYQIQFIEDWINEVLQEAKLVDIPGLRNQVLNHGPLQEFDLDRFSLMKNFHLQTEEIERIYQALYVHSIGFFNILSESTQRITHGKEYLISNIWKVFAILLECCCQIDYQLITRSIEERAQQKITKY